MVDSLLHLGDGRELAYIEIGESDWPCVLFFHGAPASRLRIAYLERAFVEARVRLIAPDRPSYGASSPQPGRALSDWPADVNALANATGVERFIVAGHSSGGPYALACAALLPDRVSAAITLGGVTDFAWAGAWDGYPEVEARAMRISDEDEAMAFCAARFGADGGRFLAEAGFELSNADERLYADEAIASSLTAAREEAFRQGVAGYAQDLFVQGRPWPFDAAAITCPVHVVHGADDALLPVAHSHHTAELIPGSDLKLEPGHGHFSILNELPAMASALFRSLD